MKNVTWGLLGPESIGGERRTRTLGIGAAVRDFNDLAVPGLGGVWFGKQLFLATLGIAVAQRARELGENVQNIEVANAIEALSCFAVLKKTRKRDARLRGATKLQGKKEIPFSAARKREFYVTQPMRMTTVQTLPALGFVSANGSRFNAFKCTNQGQDFIDEICRPNNPCSYSTTIFDFLVRWVQGKSPDVGANSKLIATISTLEPLPPQAKEILKERLIQGDEFANAIGKLRRRNALTLVDSLRKNPTSEVSWEQISEDVDDAHRHDLEAGAMFFRTRDAAIHVLNEIETHMADQGKQSFALGEDIPFNVQEGIVELRSTANQFLKLGHSMQQARSFCEECAGESDAAVLAALARRDERVLRFRNNSLLRGPAFHGRDNQASENGAAGADIIETASASDIVWPEGLSSRMHNLFLLNLDLHGELSAHLDRESSNGSEE